jgi:hypothetical protein
MYVEDTPVGKVEIVFEQNKGMGITECILYDMSVDVHDREPSGKGKAQCSLNEFGGFSHKKGKKIALLRAMKDARWDKGQRATVWYQLDCRGWLREGEKFRG